MRSECGARARFRKPLPGGSGPLLGRHDDRSPRSAVDSRQIEAGNARQVGSQETQELELSQRRMRSPWRVPRRSAERRAARDRAAAAQQMKLRGSWLVRISALRLPSFRSHDLVRKPDATFRDHAWGGDLLRTSRGSQSSDAQTLRENDFHCRAGQGRAEKVRAIPSPLIPAKAGIQTGSPPSWGRAARFARANG
jgi:hypothetical protein